MPHDQLATIAEIAATLLGFVAVFLALSKEKGRFSQSDRHFIQALVLCCAFAIVFSLLPAVLSYSLEEAQVWWVSQISAGFAALAIMGLMLRHQVTMQREEAEQIAWLWHAPNWALGTLATVLLILTFIYPGSAAGLFLLGVACMIPLSLWCFITLIFRRYF